VCGVHVCVCMLSVRAMHACVNVGVCVYVCLCEQKGGEEGGKEGRKEGGRGEGGKHLCW